MTILTQEELSAYVPPIPLDLPISDFAAKLDESKKLLAKGQLKRTSFEARHIVFIALKKYLHGDSLEHTEAAMDNLMAEAKAYVKRLP